MGIGYSDARILWEAWLRGTTFQETLTIGHLSLFLHRAELQLLRSAFTEKYPRSETRPLAGYRFGEYSDQFLRTFLRVSALTILDYSAYEGANMVHDLNKPVPSEHWGRYDAIIDGGSLEHVFNFPVAIASLMRMLKVGGSIFIVSPANNLCGHGFYQFSPELMFRVFAKENGFELRRIVLLKAAFPSVERTSNHEAYEVNDPAVVGKRVGLISKRPVVMMVEARKLADRTPFAPAPLQSDYLEMWEKSALAVQRRGFGKIVRRIVRAFPKSLQDSLHGYRELRSWSFSNAQVYRKLPW